MKEEQINKQIKQEQNKGWQFQKKRSFILQRKWKRFFQLIFWQIQ